MTHVIIGDLFGADVSDTVLVAGRLRGAQDHSVRRLKIPAQPLAQRHLTPLEKLRVYLLWGISVTWVYVPHIIPNTLIKTT